MPYSSVLQCVEPAIPERFAILMFFLMLAGCGGGGGGTSATPFEPAPSTADQSAVPGAESSVTNEQVPASESGTDPLGEPEVPEDAETGDEPEVNPAAPASTNETPEPSVPVTAPPEEAQSATAEDPEPTEGPPGDATAQCVEAMTDEDLTDEQRNELEDWANLNCEALVLINDFRSRPGDCGGTGYPAVDPVAFDSRLGRAAMVHSADMAFWNFFSHTGSDGSSFVDRISRTGFSGQPVNENIAAGYSTIQNVIDGWIDSEGHCRNLRSASITHFGIAMAANDTSDYFRYWTFNGGRK